MSMDDEIVKYFNRHVVPVFFTLQKEQDTQNFVLTAFVLSISDQWFLITAGHCIRCIENLVKDHGYEIARCLLIDSLGSGAVHRELIPFGYQESQPTYLSDGYGFDYGVMVLSPYYKQLLEANKVEALSERVWKEQPAKVDFHLLLGIPAEFVQVDLECLRLVPTLRPVTALDQRPEGFADVEATLFYGRIALGEDVHSIEGMSGGPVFAFHQNEQGELRYWLIALQSSWLPKSRFVAACPTKLLGHFLEELTTQVGQR